VCVLFCFVCLVGVVCKEEKRTGGCGLIAIAFLFFLCGFFSLLYRDKKEEAEEKQKGRKQNPKKGEIEKEEE
jgi:hypothetical protein